jgi:hypothetical protein
MSNDLCDPPEPPKSTPRRDYTVGYCRPPVEHQCKKGQPSKNPKGRPRRKLNGGHGLEGVSRETVAYTQAGKRRWATLFELFLTRIFEDAVKGDRKAQGQILAMRQRFLRSKPANSSGPGFPLPVTVWANGVVVSRTAGGGRGNKKRKTESRRQMFERLAARKILVRDNKIKKRMTYEQAIARSVYAGALSGDPKAWALIVRFVDVDAVNSPSKASDIIDKNGVLKVTLNLGKLPAWIDDDDEEDQAHDAQVIEDDSNQDNGTADD